MDFQKNFEAPMLGNVSSSSGSSCHECQELLKELQLKDKTIQDLREKLQNIQQICNSGGSPLDSASGHGHQEVLEPKVNTVFHHSSNLRNTFRTPPVSSDSESSVDGAKDDNTTGFNLKLVKLEPSPPIASIKLELFDEEHQGSNSSFGSFMRPHQENRNEVSKITVQEIIDKVIERSPKRDESLKTRNVENICNSFNTLLSKLESQAESKERSHSELWNGSSEDQSSSSNEQTFVNRPPPTTASTTASGGSGSSSCTDLVLHSSSKRNLYSCCSTIPNTTTSTTTTEFSSLKAKPNNNINETSNSSSFGLSDNSSRKRKSFAVASSSEQPSSTSSSSASAALFSSSTNSNFHQPPPPPAVGHHHHHFVYYPKSIPTFPYYAPHQQQVSNIETSSSKSHHFLQCPKCSRSFSTQLTLLVHMKDCCQDVNVTPTVTPTPTFNFAVCCSSNSNSGGALTAEPLPDQIPKAVLNRIPIGTDISMVYNMHNNGNHISAGGITNAKSNYANVRKY